MRKEDKEIMKNRFGKVFADGSPASMLVLPNLRAHQSVKTWFLNLVVTRNVFSKCPRHCTFVSVSNAHARD